MGGVRVATIVCGISFLLGCFCTHWIADSVTLWQTPLTDSHLHVAAAYYSILSTTPKWMEWIIVLVGTAAAAGLVLSIIDGRADNLMFDGGSLVLSSCALGMWSLSVLPNLDRLSNRLDSSLPFPSSFRKTTLEVASSNLFCSVALTGVLLLQASREWAEVKDTDVEDEPIPGAIEEDISPSVGGELLGTSAARGRRRSHHDHLADDIAPEPMLKRSPSASTSPRKRDGSQRRRKGLGLRK